MGIGDTLSLCITNEIRGQWQQTYYKKAIFLPKALNG